MNPSIHGDLMIKEKIKVRTHTSKCMYRCVYSMKSVYRMNIPDINKLDMKSLHKMNRIYK